MDRDIMLDDLASTKVRENMQAAVEKQAQIRCSTKTPIYLKSIEYAVNHNEYESFRKSLEESRNCIHEITEKIHENYSDNILHTGYETQIVDNYGLARVKYVLATIIQNNDWDERYSRTNKAWAIYSMSL